MEIQKAGFDEQEKALENELSHQKGTMEMAIKSLEEQLAAAPVGAAAGEGGYPAYFKDIASPAATLDSIAGEFMPVSTATLSLIFVYE